MIPFFFIFGEPMLFFLRLALGAIFISHGFSKIRNIKANALNFEMMGFKPGILWGTIVAIIEPLGGLLLIFGLFTQIAAVVLTVQMAVALAWRIRSKHAFVGGYELDLLIVASLLTLASMGSAFYSLDALLGIQLTHW